MNVLLEATATMTKRNGPIRVSFAVDDLSRAGTEMQLLALIDHLDRDDVQPSLVLLNGESEASRALEPKDCPVLRLGLSRLVGLGTPAAARRLRGFWKNRRPDVLQSYFLDSAYFTVPIAKAMGVPHVVRVRNNLGYWLTPRHRLLNNLLAPAVSRVLTNSDEGRMALIASGTPDRKVVVLENGVDLDRFRGFPPPLSRLGTPHIGTVANLRTVKNIDGLMRAARLVLNRMPEVRFTVVGDGPERGKLEALRQELNLGENFTLLGPTNDIPGYLRSLDLFVLPSHSEGMSNALLEAMAAGRAMVATNVGANGKLLAGGCGTLVKPGDPTALAEAIQAMLADPRTAQSCSRAAQTAAEDYGRPQLCRRFVEFYRGLMRI